MRPRFFGKRSVSKQNGVIRVPEATIVIARREPLPVRCAVTAARGKHEHVLSLVLCIHILGRRSGCELYSRHQGSPQAQPKRWRVTQGAGFKHNTPTHPRHVERMQDSHRTVGRSVWQALSASQTGTCSNCTCDTSATPNFFTGYLLPRLAAQGQLAESITLAVETTLSL